MKKKKKEFLALLCKINDPQEMDLFLQDILTISEYEDVVIRLQITKMLKAGISQRKIAKELGVAIATVTRGSNMLKESKNV
ncbi:trp operon repressor [Patescibacteria group bacterium]|nr:trp operon repressor [Patescibacteria group bacterium]MBU1721529.1 trp operon repressor [Patescibacteria group bacterium]MBU1901495.1 trp operon repressor [Patescibacteria group bacterium]